MRKILAVLTCGAMLSLAGSATAATITVPGFEGGDLTGWTLSHVFLGEATSNLAPVGGGAGDPAEWLPQDGNYFGYAASGGGHLVETILSTTITADAGDTLQFWIFFDAGDYLPYNDYGFARIVDGPTLYYKDVASVGDLNSNGWTFINHTFASAGNYTLEIGVANVQDNGFNSHVGVDAAAVPEPATLALLGTGLALVVARRRRAARV